ncbi:fibronectin type III domain-containing protein [Nocardioides rubriscoriae]|uniref:fibronectin type III domain-containing protein n=1 Tax=Nocardioides rubriscoriae TaxID=642762 RepID=UPI0011DF11F8|nr:fibronectin type III domain-containing protein [Nocardioides rubriscoriae]
MRRHRVAIASNLALLVAVTGMVVVATQADGYRTHDAQLNDGGIWVTNGRDGFHGRINKPIAQLDGVAFVEQDTQLDVVQDGAAVLGIDVSAGVLSTLDPGKVALLDGEDATLPAAAQVGLAGGTAAVLDPAAGTLWAERVDTRLGVPPVSALDAGTDPLATTGEDAGLAVTLDGQVLVASTSDDVLRRFAPTDAGLAAPTRTPLGADLGPATTVTAVGDRAVVLDGASGALRVVGGPDTDVTPDATLQVPGPDAGSVLVTTTDSLLAVDLDTGDETTLVDGVSGRPTPPVRLGACVYGAWSGGLGTVATVCDGAEPRVSGLGTRTTDLVFRVNRGEIVLNDRTTGAVWDIDSDQPTRLDDWDAFQLKPDPSDDKDDNNNEDQGDRRPPEAKDDDLGARRGRTTVLHPLDNDTAPAGRLLAIAGVGDVTGSDADISISPDGQTVQVTLPDDAGPTRFDYTIDDGRSGLSDTATVRVTPRSDDVDAPPQLREGFEKRDWTVPAGGTLDIPVLPDWRDKQDGDPLSLASAEAKGGERSGALARPTSAGRVRFTAPATSGVVTVAYGVSDGIGEPVEDELQVRVQDVKDRKAFPGTAEPDVVSGEAGKTLTIRPLANDLPGSDPVNPTALVELAGQIAQVGGAEVRTDLVDGTISFTADQPRTYFLDYDLRYGNAPFDAGRIRVDVKAPDRPPAAPVAMPDSLTVYGQAASLVDVVANDVDPSGGILVVQGAEADRGGEESLDVAVVQGRWLRIAARTGDLAPNPQLVRYTISNGSRSGIQGQVVVTWRPAPADNTPVTEVDRVVVRAGGAVSVPVLDNDFSPAGDELELVGDVPGQDAGVLAVQGPGDDARAPTGQAFVTHRFVRYVAPQQIDDTETYTVRYLASNAGGQRAPGTLEVQVVPADRRNQPPEPPALEGRAVAGDTITLRLPGADVDPDGDPVTLTGIASGPELGRIVRFGATSLVYQAYPGSVGTDEFSYTVIDALGAPATGTVRVAVTAPGTPQPPLAVPDTLTTEPGRTARLDVLANDYVAAGDRVEVELVGRQPGVSLESPQGPLVVQVPARGDGRTIEAVYRVTNGLESSQTTATVRLSEPFNNPPVAFDAYGTPAVEGSVDAAAVAGGEVDGRGDASTVTVDVLETAYDPDGDDADLSVAEVFAPPGVTASVADGTVTVARGDEPRVVSFRVVDADGGSATASVFVPPLAGEAPYVVPGAVLEVEPGATADFDLADYVVDPAGGPVIFTLKDRVSGSPASAVVPRITGKARFEVTAADTYQGPGALVFEVTTGESVDDPDGVEATVSVPVQVGSRDPILRCPTQPVRIAQDRTLSLDIASLCHVWTPEPDEVDALSFDADWNTSVDGLAIIQGQGRTIEINAAGTTAPGSRAELKVTSGGSDPGLIQVVVVRSPPPTLVPIRLDDMRAGQQRTFDLAPYLRPGVATPEPTVVSIEQLTGLDVQATADGSSVRLRTGAVVDGRAEFRVVMSDVAGSSGPERQAEGRLVLDVLDVPDRPTAPVPGTAVRDQEVALSWRAPEANGAPIDRYEVRSGGERRECGGTSCEVSGLVNGRDYRFEVRAHNAVGWSAWSPRSAVATPDARPGRVGPITLVKEGDTFLKLRWTPPTTQTSDIKQYVVSWQDGGSTTTRRPEVTATGLDNNQAYSFTVYAINETFPGEKRVSATFQSLGTPQAPAQPTITEQRTSSDETAVVVSWPPVDPPNGPGPVRYTVLRDGKALPACSDQTATQCTNAGIQYDGTTYSYTVRATNKDGAGRTSAPSQAATFQAVGEPEPWGPWTLDPSGDNKVGRTTYTVPDSNGAQSRVRLYRDGALYREADATGQRNEAVATPDNDRAHTFQLEVCNEKSACVRSEEKLLQTYGPLVRQHIVNMTPETQGRRVRWSVTVDTNGNPARLEVTRISSGYGLATTMSIDVVDTYSFTTGWNDIGYNNTEQLKLKIFDNSPDRGYGERQARSSPTDNPPAPTVTISKGASCRDGTSNPCSNGSTGSPCTVSACARIRFESANWPFNPMFCDVYDSVDGQYITNRQVATNRSVEPGPYFGYPDRSVWVRCGDSSGNVLAESNHLNWY